MYIKSIKTQGFKSFADKLELDFNEGITAIVGPNGSGKSNIVDALLWGLGEQSVKSLRGDSSMSDVIFSGSKSREALKKASVAITFDNSDKTLNTEFNEVEIKRVIYQSGENEYYINNAKVRLKDITDLLMDVTSKFNIISQGNINALVENKSSERRNLFENAAGVLKYKKRKEESLKKLDGTKENITRINLIIKELNTTLKPLEKQKNDAEKYLKIKNELNDLDISLMAHDINVLTNNYNKLKSDITFLEDNLSKLELVKPETLEKEKLLSVTLNEEINNLNQSLIKINEEIASLNSQKQINLERSKFKLDKDTINLNLVSLNENKLKQERLISVANTEINTLKSNLKPLLSEYNKLTDNELKSKLKITNLNNSINNLNKEIMFLQNKISIEKSNLENNAFLPKSVNSILNNPRLNGIHNTIGNLIEVNDAHILAINTALGASANFIVVDNMNSAKGAINYLKDYKLGRATFFPIDTIKSRHVGKDIEYTLENLHGYIGIASDLVSYAKTYQGIIENQLGNVIVVDNMDALFTIAKKLEYKYKMVSLDGEIVFPGGSIQGGKANDNVTTNRANLNSLNKDLDTKNILLNNNVQELKDEEKNHNTLLNESNSINQKISEIRFNITNKEKIINEYNNELETINKDINSITAMDNNTIDKEIDTIINNINDKNKEKDLLEAKIADNKSKLFDLNNKINELEKENNEKNQNYHKVENDLKEKQIESGKIEVRIDTLLQNLSEEYNISFEAAQNNYILTLEEDLAREKVTTLKNSLKGLTNINVGSIPEYERLKKRFDFLDKQREDLEKSSDELHNIITEMDDIMKDKFKKTFEQISATFSKIFREMFKGGNGLLKLADENDLLNTGINILAVPPGKKLNSTASLSGGEKALTAICLIFAILAVKPTPFVVLDEVEAPLDEENVSMFGEYLSNLKNNNQFILITHKKKMMEYADILYGITMQESGVSKLVSVKLDD